MTKTLFYKVIFLLFVCGLVWFSPSLTDHSTNHAQQDSINAAFIPAVISIENGDKKISLNVEIAADDASQRQGMMHRKDWGNIEGMLFVFEDELVRHFWMQNTHLSLDIIFFDASGRLVHIADRAEPLSEDLISSNMPARYVLEIPAGDAKQRQLNPSSILNTNSFTKQLP